MDLLQVDDSIFSNPTIDLFSAFPPPYAEKVHTIGVPGQLQAPPVPDSPHCRVDLVYHALSNWMITLQKGYTRPAVQITTSASCSDQDQGYAAGYVEGALSNPSLPGL